MLGPRGSPRGVWGLRAVSLATFRSVWKDEAVFPRMLRCGLSFSLGLAFASMRNTWCLCTNQVFSLPRTFLRDLRGNRMQRPIFGERHLYGGG